MDCKQARIQLYQGERSLALWAHLVLCGKCRAEARALRHLERAISAAPRPEPPAALLANILAIAQEEQAPAPAQDKLKPAPWKRSGKRLLFWLVWALIALLLAAGLAAAYRAIAKQPNGSKKLSPKLLPARPVNGSVYVVNRNWEIWFTSDHYYSRVPGGPEGKPWQGVGLDLKQKKCWFYVPESTLPLVADFTLIAPEVAKFLARNRQFCLNDEDVKYLKEGTTLQFDTLEPDWATDLELSSKQETLPAKLEVSSDNWCPAKYRETLSIAGSVGRWKIQTSLGLPWQNQRLIEIMERMKQQETAQ